MKEASSSQQEKSQDHCPGYFQLQGKEANISIQKGKESSPSQQEKQHKTSVQEETATASRGRRAKLQAVQDHYQGGGQLQSAGESDQEQL